MWTANVVHQCNQKDILILSGGHDDGHIQLWDVGIPTLPQYTVTPVHLLKIPPIRGGDVYNLLYSREKDLLIAGCESGLYAWNFELNKVKKDLK